MHIMAERAWIRTRYTARCSRFQGECLRPDSAISPSCRRLEDNFRTLIATGFEFPEVVLPFRLEAELDSQGCKSSDTTEVTGVSSQIDVPSEDADNPVSACGVLHSDSPESSEQELTPAAGRFNGNSGEWAYPVHAFSGDYSDRAQIEYRLSEADTSPSLADDPLAKEYFEMSSILSKEDEADIKPLQLFGIVMSRFDRVEIYRQVWTVPINRVQEILGT
jgi:hypothetical protein